MLETGIVSVTFRQLGIDEIIGLCRDNKLASIEVGSDVHAPEDDVAVADKIARLAGEAGVRVASYGTYYRLGQYDGYKVLTDGTQSPANGQGALNKFGEYMRSAKALGTTNLRLWAGAKGSGQTSAEERKKLVDETKLLAGIAASEGKTLSFEYHSGTLTDNVDSALDFIESVAETNVSLYWQPNQNHDREFNIAALKRVLPYVSNLHVFAWDARSGSCIRYPLADHAEDWKYYLDIVSGSGRDHSLLLEFVKNDSPEQLIADAATLNEWVNER